MATSILSAGASVMSGRAAENDAKANQQIAERNAEKLRMDAETAIKLGKRDVKIFESQFSSLQAQSEMAYLKSGVTLEGTPLEQLESMYAQAEMEKETIMYNAKVDSADKIELSVIEQMQGAAALARGKNAKRASYLKAGSTLLQGAQDAAAASTTGSASDVRLKKDIQYLGKHEKGFGVYKWNWNNLAKSMGIDDPTVGVLAQELIKYIPEAVSIHPKGYLQVNYSLVVKENYHG